MDYYTYDDNGQFLEHVVSDTQPKNSTLFPPPETGSGSQAIFDGLGWRIVSSYEGLALNEAKDKAMAELEQVKFVHIGNYVYSPAEQQSFDPQYAEALEVVAGGEPGVYLGQLMAVYGLTAKELADKIIAKREIYTAAHAEFNAKVQSMRLRIQGAKSAEELPHVAEIRKL